MLLANVNKLPGSFLISYHNLFFFFFKTAAIRSPKKVVSCVLLRTNPSSGLLHNLIIKAWYHFGFHVRQPHKSNYILSKARLLLLEPVLRGAGAALYMVILPLPTTHIATFVYLPSQQQRSAGILPAPRHPASVWRIWYQLVNNLAMVWRCKAAAKS